jgi:hypothetical protein
VILAVAVLSILLTAPLGAIGIAWFGERILDRGERSSYRFEDLREIFGLPRVGERVRSKRYGTVWKVIEEKETWIKKPATAIETSQENNLVPAIHLRYWREDTSPGPGRGKTMSYRYSQEDRYFSEHWEILYDW